MAPSAEPAAEISHLPKADGSATFSYGGYAVIAAVNGPVEAQRRDENAFEALVDVIVRPAAGVGGTRERQLESIMQAAIRQLIPVRDYPRCVIQITLQVAETPENAYVNAKLVQAQLVSFNVKPECIGAATLLAIPEEEGKDIIVDPSAIDIDHAKSVHVLGFTSHDELLLSESEGVFTSAEWTKVLQLGQLICCEHQQPGFDTAMSGDDIESKSMRQFIRSVMEAKVTEDLYWK
ncbi:RRP46-like protein [Fusarium beomiforme]|uniref:RRP46-like protein n=1 Tax=Fusarium beomiforme TaxID=44412 RepID=A0A9P5DZ67_9HYPO|nr:RRP46-like protein [Fusarium beomiforme]